MKKLSIRTFSAIAVLVVVAALGAIAGTALFGADTQPESATPAAADARPIFKCGYAAQRAGSVDPDCAGVKKPKAPSSLELTALDAAGSSRSDSSSAGRRNSGPEAGQIDARP